MTDSNSSLKATTIQNRSAPQNFTASVPSNLPVLHARLVGRDKELNLIRDLLLREDVNLVTLTGLGGAGKTSLGLRVASSLPANFPGGVFFVGLASLTKSEMILIEIARILKVEEVAKKNILQALKDVLSGHPILLVLDNFEHLMQGATQVDDLLQTFPLLKIMVTSREPLRLRSEQTFPVRSLSNEYSVELFAKRAQSLNPDFSLTKRDTESVIELCRRLDGLPLAIELAALRTKLFTPQALLARLKPDLKPATPILDLLSLGARDLPKRQQSLRNTIAWSYGLLQAEEQRVFRTASIFPAGFSIQLLSALLNQNENDVLEVVSSLVDKNLVKSSLEKHDEPRFILLDSIREYAWDEILRLEELDGLKEAYVDIYLSLAEGVNARLRGDDSLDWLGHLDDEFMNINLALEMCVTSSPGSKRWIKGYKILHSFHRYWTLHGHFYIATEYVTRARKSIEEYESKNPESAQQILELKADIYSLSGTFAWVTGNYGQGRDWHAAAYKTYMELGDEQGMAESLNNWAVNLGQLGDYERSIEKHEMGLTLSRKNNDRWGEMRHLNNIGNVFQYMDKTEDALLSFETGLAIARELNDNYFVSSFMHNIAHLKVRDGDYENAVSLLQPCLEMGQHAQPPYLYAWTLAIYGLAHIYLGRLQQAVNAIVEGITISEKITDMALKIEFLQTAVFIFIFMGMHHKAAQMIGTIERIHSEIRFKGCPSDILAHKQLSEKVRSTLSKDEYGAARLMGMKLTLESALAFVVQNLGKPTPVDSDSPQTYLLTAREQEVLVLLSRGLTNEQISSELVVVLKTVEKHVAGILRKIGAKNRTEAVAWAIKNGLANSE